jgi:hypothetical protein
LGVVVIIIGLVLYQRPARVVLVGDSIAAEAAPYLDEAVDQDVVDHVFGGTAPCDWSLDDLGIEGDDLVVLSFTGNSLTPCMSDGAGGFLESDALVAKYEQDVGALVDGIRELGARVLLVGQPAHAPGGPAAEVVDPVNEVYESMATSDGVDFVDAGAALEAPDGAFAADLPCVPGEAECGPDGRNPVRHPDGVHLCPVNPEAGRCPVYASGAFRFATAIGDAIAASEAP